MYFWRESGASEHQFDKQFANAMETATRNHLWVLKISMPICNFNRMETQTQNAKILDIFSKSESIDVKIEET